MIQEAHIGIGIYGKEGSQAARSSDYSIHRFKHLHRLLYHHGRYSIIRSEKLIYYAHYKNFAFMGTVIWFAIFSFFSGMTLFDSTILGLFNVVITGLPPFMLGLGDRDLKERQIDKYPEAFGELKHIYLTAGKFIQYIIIAIYQSLIFFFVPYFLWGGGNIWADGHSSEYWIFSISIALPAALTVLLNFIIISTYWTFHVFSGFTLSYLALVLMLYVESALGGISIIYWNYLTILFQSGTFWFSLLFIPITASLPTILILYIQRQFSPYFWQILSEKKKKHFTTVEM